MTWLNGISITCFAASYSVVLLLELSRILFRAPFRKLFSLTMLVAGLFAHAVFVVLQTEVQIGADGFSMGSWSGWILSAAWILMAATLWILLKQPKSIAALLLIPMALAMVFCGGLPFLQAGFSEGSADGQAAESIWNMVHGNSLLVGTAVVALGCMFGVMYLVHSFRLKKKLPPLKRFRFPSLEWLQRAAEISLFVSAALLAVGLLSGIAINSIHRQAGSTVLSWSDPVVWSSVILFSWLAAVSIFAIVYRPARQGRKVAYLVVASFAFLVLELGIVWWVGHGNSSNAPDLVSVQVATEDPSLLEDRP